MRLTASTAAAILAITLARAGAVPSPQGGADGDFDLSHGAEGTDFQKRNPHEGGGGAGGGGGGGLASYMDGSRGQGSPYTNWQKTGDAHGYQPTGAPGGGGGDKGGMGGGMGGMGGKGGEGEKGQNWGTGHQRRSDDNDDDAADETDSYANIACNCFHDPVETDATGLPTVRCGCFRLNNDGSPDLDKRGKTGIIDPFTDWDWWQNQGMKGWDLTPGNPNVPYVDYKFGLWANVGGLGKRDADKTHNHHNGAASGGGGGWSGEARPKNDHSHENHKEQ